MFIMVTGNTDAGKSTLAAVMQARYGHPPVVEYTTRPMRENETQDVSYHFVDDDTFDRMDFVESLHMNTMFGLWKYGARACDIVESSIIACGPKQAAQLLESGMPMLSVLLDIGYDQAMERSLSRGDDPVEFKDRFYRNSSYVDEIRNRVDLLIDSASASVDETARIVENAYRAKCDGLYPGMLKNRLVITSQPMSAAEKNLYLDGNNGIRPYLRYMGQGMPKDAINQVAWLLLSGSGCGFCKVCRHDPCGIKDGEKCTKNIADYIRDIVHKEDYMKRHQIPSVPEHYKGDNINAFD